MQYFKKTVIFLPLLLIGVVGVAPKVSADGCAEYTQAPSSQSPDMLTIIDTEVGTDAYQRLVEYGNGGHEFLGMAIAKSYDYFGQCQFVGIGIMDGSGGNGFRPNFTLAIWYEGIDLNTARSVIYALIESDEAPVVTNGDCNVSCDGTTGTQFDGTIINESTTTTTTIQTVVSTPLIVSEPTVEESVIVVQENEQPLSESIATSAVVDMVLEPTTTTTIPLVSSSAMVMKEPIKKIITKKPVVTKKKKAKKAITHRKR